MTRTGPTLGLQVSKPQPGGPTPVRVTTAFNRLLALPGTTVRDVSFEPAQITVTVALRRRRLACADCSHSSRARYDTRTVDSSWRHLDLGRLRLVVKAKLRRIDCPEHGVRTEACRSLGSSRASPATSRTWWRGWPPGWTRPRSVGSSGSPGRRSGRSALGWSPTSSTRAGWRRWLRSASTRCPGVRGTAPSPWSPTIAAARSCGAPKARTPPPATCSSPSWTPAAPPSSPPSPPTWERPT